MDKYDPSKIEKKWQKVWEKSQVYRAVDFDKKPKYYVLVEFPYPSGAGLHVGHARPWAPTDAFARKKRMEGYNVLFPMGWDAFGLPAENYAIKMGVHPAKITAENVAKFKTQCQALGLSFDWSREINTSDPKYYKWTQWIFVQLFKQGLAYQDEVLVNWCPFEKTNLADEEVLPDGTHERCGTPIEKRRQKQWLLRITRYADRLIEDLKKVDFPERVAVQQVNWIGKKEGAEIDFQIKGSEERLRVFTTRPDTLLGVTFIVLSPDSALVDKLVTREREEQVKEYRAISGRIRTLHEPEAELEIKDKTGEFTGSYAIHPLTGKEIPIWVANYVIGGYGTGVVMGVPAYDERDREFAEKFKLPILKEPLVRFSELEKKEAAKKTTIYHLHDWVFSRQHYWGEPIPIIHCPKDGPVAVLEDQLPVELPYLEKYQPTGTGESPLAQATDWVNVTCPKCGGKAKRETDTMPNWAGSNWYFVRYLDPHNDKELASKKLMDYWLPVDVYEGGYEHTTLHLLYSRFIYKFLYDIKAVSGPEPYASRRVHGIVLAADNRKMSKSFGNVINPDDVIAKFGADTMRLYVMFMGPFDEQVSWDDRSLAGCYRFLSRVWQLSLKNGVKTDSEVAGKLGATIRKVSQDLDQMKFNTAVAALMEFVNVWEKGTMAKTDINRFLTLLAPFAPHLAEESWSILGHSDSVHTQKWPEASVSEVEQAVTIVVSVNGKARAKLDFSASEAKVLDQKQVELAAKSDNRVAKYLTGKTINRVVYVPGKIINLVV